MSRKVQRIKMSLSQGNGYTQSLVGSPDTYQHLILEPTINAPVDESDTDTLHMV
jgi:hypothetical protein